MSFSSYRRAVLDDDPMLFHPLVLRHPGTAAGMYVNEAPRRIGGSLAPNSGNNLTVPALYPRSPMGDCEPWVVDATGNDSMMGEIGDLNTNHLTVEMWIYMTSSGAHGDIYPFNISSTAAGTPFTGFRYYLGNFDGYIGNTVGSNFDTASIPAVRGRWVHLCMTYDGTARRLLFSLDAQIYGPQVTGTGSRQGVNSRLFVGRYNNTFGTLRWPAGCGGMGLAIYDRFDPSLAGRHYRAARGGAKRVL